MNPEEQYVLINQDNKYYQEFDEWEGISKHTNTIHHAWIYTTIDDAKQAIKDIKEWTLLINDKLNDDTYVVAKIVVSVEIIEDNN
jgi:predicted RNase H-like HicB family nuclease